LRWGNSPPPERVVFKIGRRVKCRITGEFGDSNDFVKIDGKYYKSQKIYDIKQKENQDRQDIIDRFCYDFLDYKPGQIFPTILTKKLKELEFYGYGVINKTIDKSYKSIQYALSTKEFKNDIGKISYIFAIIKNNINDVYRDVLREEKESETTKTFEIDTSVDIDNIQTQHEEKNISKWLEDDDWL